MAEETTSFSTIASISTPLIGSHGNIPTGEVEEVTALGLSVTQDSAIVGSKNPLGNIVVEEVNGRDEIVVHTVEKGDTPSHIAKQFGISLNTLLWANNLTAKNVIKEGDKLVILPVSGIRYKVAKGDTLQQIAKRFKGDVEEIVSFNNLASEGDLIAGETIIIPNGELSLPPSSRRPASSRYTDRLPAFDGYYARPILGGRKTQGTHGYNGVDLADTCGMLVFASSGGNVIIARDSGWNGGYGKYIVINHPNKTQTLYAHLGSVTASTGQYVGRGMPVGTIGSTGNSTGCHVHFEIRGAKNPF